jgi:hypothetical protein
MLQHARIRATYDLDGTVKKDCLQSFFCLRCTVMQHDREIFDREQRAREAASGTISHQPSRIPSMQFPPPSLDNTIASSGSTISHRGSLVAANKVNVTVTTKDQSSNGQGQGSQDQLRPKKLRKVPKIVVNGMDLRDVGNLANGRNSQDGHSDRKKGKDVERIEMTDIASTSNTGKTKKQDKHEKKQDRLEKKQDKQAIIAARQPWRAQKATEQNRKNSDGKGPRSVSFQHKLAQCSEDDARSSDSQDQGKKRVSSMDSYKPKRNSSNASGTGSHGRTRTETSDVVPVYYNDGELPQRHRLADCARTRASTRQSTVGIPESARFGHNLSDCLSDDIGEQPEASEASGAVKQHNLAGCVRIPSTDTLLTGIERTKSLELSRANHRSENDKADGSQTANEQTDLSKPHHLAECAQIESGESFETPTQRTEPIQQHRLSDCAETESTTTVADSTAAEVDSTDSAINTNTQHLLKDCRPGISEDVKHPVAQHSLNDCAGDAGSAARHNSSDCAIDRIRASLYPESLDEVMNYPPPASAETDPKEDQNDNDTAEGGSGPSRFAAAQHVLAACFKTEPEIEVEQVEDTRAHGLAECVTVQELVTVHERVTVQESVTVQVVQPASIEQHDLADCVTVTVPAVQQPVAEETESTGPAQFGPAQHDLSDCTTVEIAVPTASEQHDLADCTTVSITSKATHEPLVIVTTTSAIQDTNSDVDDIQTPGVLITATNTNTKPTKTAQLHTIDDCPPAKGMKVRARSITEEELDAEQGRTDTGMPVETTTVGPLTHNQTIEHDGATDIEASDTFSTPTTVLAAALTVATLEKKEILEPGRRRDSSPAAAALRKMLGEGGSRQGSVSLVTEPVYAKLVAERQEDGAANVEEGEGEGSPRKGRGRLGGRGRGKKGAKENVGSGVSSPV